MASSLRVLHVKEGEGTETARLGPYEIETLIPVSDEGAATAYRVRIEPHQRTSTSYHKLAEELYLVLAGSGISVLDGVEHALRAGDFLRLPPGTTHAFITSDEALVMLDVHTPGSRPDRDVYFVGETPAGFSVPSPVT
ncbi:cupin domain-containing protein [Luteolibacter arcticus]|uniref:Cupin domain-containing protein n=1 Tax=Luteolibacter arcticus TaxID=1581411 RepID=A0ABT3GE12_9BACT|nr:cupin domain-containing protein [Luteolibacter arcticus]MCW1921851.1 cupin domain-containing protein [Luteolibacter arcticus]